MTNIIPLNNQIWQSQLPAPQWESVSWPRVKTMSDWNPITGSEWWARLPLVDQKLIDNGELFVEYWRIKQQSFRLKYDVNWWKIKRRRASKIRWYSDWDGNDSIRGRWYSTGQHEVAIPRRNMFPVISQSFIAPPVPRYSFYRMAWLYYYNWDHSVLTQFFEYSVPVVCGSKKNKIQQQRLDNTEKDIAKKRVAQNKLKDVMQHSSEWYCRLVVMKEWRVVQQWPISEPLFIEVSGMPPWDEIERIYKFPSLENNIFYANTSIWHQNKQ